MLRARLTVLVLSFMIAQAAAAAPVPDVTEEEREPERVLEYVGDYRVTAYNYYEGDGENYGTAGGYDPQPYYTCAAPYDFDMGTVLYIEGLGEVQVQDRGAFPDYIIDLHIGYDSIESFDDRMREVYIVRYE